MRQDEFRAAGPGNPVSYAGAMSDSLTWFKVADVDAIAVGSVTVVQAGHFTLALSRTGDGWGAVSNRCPHQGGPLGEGLIEGQ